MEAESPLVPVEQIERAILLIRGEKVILDADLATLYEVETRVLVQAVKRHTGTLPGGFYVPTDQGGVRST